MYIKPNVSKGTASNYDVPASGNAGTNQLVKGDDTRLTDARNAADVTNTYSASGTVPVSGTAVASAIGDLDVTGDSSVSASKTLASWSETDGKVSITTQNISITKSQVSDFPSLGTASAKDVPTSGNASTTQVVMGDDTRLTDSRNAADVYSWAKASSKPSYTASEVGAIPVKSGTTAAQLQSGASGSNNDCNSTTYNAITYYTSNGPTTAIGHSTSDGSLYSQSYNDTWVTQIAQDYRNGNLFVRGKNSGTWQSWCAIPTVTYSTTDITAGSALKNNTLYVVYEA